jgi:DNA-binding response OmpR family regulator
MADRVAVVVPDLLFGSKVVEIVKEAGHDPALVPDVDGLVELIAAEDLAAIVADLSQDGVETAEAIADARPAGVPVLACFAHVEPEVRAVALEAGLDQVVPRSRLAREGGALLQALLDD